MLKRPRTGSGPLLAKHRIQDIDLKDQIATLKNDLIQKQQEIDTFKQQLEEKIVHEKNQEQLNTVIQELKDQLQDNAQQISSLKAKIELHQDTQAQLEMLKQQLADQQNKVDLINRELLSKTAQSDRMTLVYQKKLEAKDIAYNEQLGQVLSYKNDQAQMEKQMALLSTQLHEKEAQLVKIRMDMYNLQKSTIAKDQHLQVKDLRDSMTQQKAEDGKINGYQGKVDELQSAFDRQVKEIKSKTELALSRQQLAGMPNADEIVFLRAGYNKATMELKKKDALLNQIKTDAQEYEKEFKAKSDDFKSLKDQLQDAYD